MMRICNDLLSINQPLNLQEKMHLKNLRLPKSSAANNCLTLLTNSSIEANREDPGQPAPIEAV